MLFSEEIKLGFTGSRTGLTFEQKTQIALEVRMFNPILGIHGDCIGSDYDFDCILRDLEINRKARPCNLRNQRAFCEVQESVKPKDPLVRNRDIVNESDIMFAAPNSKEEITRSGTWSTIRYAKKIKKNLIIFYPDGTRSVY